MTTPTFIIIIITDATIEVGRDPIHLSYTVIDSDFISASAIDECYSGRRLGVGNPQSKTC
jgi:hypothetical protein